MPLSLVHIDQNDYHAQEKEIKSLLKKAPYRVELFLFETADSEGININNNGDVVHALEAGKAYYKIGARIVNENRKYCAVRPDTNDGGSRGTQYKVHLKMMSSDGEECRFDYGVASDWWVYDPQVKGDVKSFTSEPNGLTAGNLSQEILDKPSHLLSYYGPNRRSSNGLFSPRWFLRR